MVATVSSALLSIGLVAAPRAADVVRIEGQPRPDVVKWRYFGTAGPYETLEEAASLSIPPFPQTASSSTSRRPPRVIPAGCVFRTRIPCTVDGLVC